MTIILFILGLFLLILSSHLFVDDAVKIANTFHLSDLFIGVTLVSIGTTLPETMVSCTASAIGHSDMAGGNVIGSIICNSALIIGIVWTLRPQKSSEIFSYKKSFIKLLISISLFCLFIYTTHTLNVFSGIVLLLLLVFHFYDLYKDSQKCIVMYDKQSNNKISIIANFLRLIAESIILFYGAKLLVTNGADIARMLNIPEHIISVSMIALGTSLPELFTAITAIYKGHNSLSLGNIIGANTLNILMVAGLSSVIAPISFSSNILLIDLPVMIFVCAILSAPIFTKQKSTRINGIILLASYLIYILLMYINK